MRKSLFINVALIASFISLCAAVAATPSDPVLPGTVRFESTEMLALNFTMPVSRAAGIYRLLPSSVTDYCRQEYEAVLDKCNRSHKVNHEGVKIQWTGANPDLTFVFTVPGYKFTVSGVSVETMDSIVYGKHE